jgi:hypothetical protein
MRFETSYGIATDESDERLQHALSERFRSITANVRLEKGRAIAFGPKTPFGSVDRADIARLEIRQVHDQALVTATVRCRPSFWFWASFVVGLFTIVLWLVPIMLYLAQKASEQAVLEKGLRRLKGEFHRAALAQSKTSLAPTIADLHTLSRLRDWRAR